MRNALIIFIILLLISGCKEEVFLTGDIRVSEIESKTNYEAPLILEDDIKKAIKLNGEEIKFENGIFELLDAGFYEMIRSQNDTVLFVLFDKERKEPEWGLKKWIPESPDYNTTSELNCTFIHPGNFYPGILIPIVVLQNNWSYQNSTYVIGNLMNGENFNIKKGIGSSSGIIENNSKIKIVINGENTDLSLNEISSEPIQLNSNIDNEISVEKNSVIHISTDIIVQQSGSLTFNEGCIVILDEGINIYNNGPVKILGSATNPVLFTCSNANKYWGGFISNGNNAEIQAEYCFFNSFAYNSSSEYQYGHAKHQALFKSKNTNLSFENCWFLDSPGQVFYPENCKLTINKCIVQRTKTSGQINNSNLIVSDSYFSDFPDDTQNYRDEDNDALYINGSDATITQSVFMYAKDDGIDSGGGDGGEVTVKNCWIEACFHEGMALSSSSPAVKTHRIVDNVIRNCQQGIELGFSSPDHSVYIEDCELMNNYIGIRYGDNYEWGINGKMYISGCNIHDNYRDIWNMVHQIWGPKNENVFIEN